MPCTSKSTGCDRRGRYWYRFRAGRGRARRPHAHGAGRRRDVDGCGSRSPRASIGSRATSRRYRHMVREDLDLVVHLGDYIYEDGPRRIPSRAHRRPGDHDARRLPQALRALPHATPICRRRTPRFRSSSRGTITRSTTTTPTIAPEDGRRGEPFLRRRAARLSGLLRAHAAARGATSARPGDAALSAPRTTASWREFLVLDTRQYRTPQPCGDDARRALRRRARSARHDPRRRAGALAASIALDKSPARWNVLAQQVHDGAGRCRRRPGRRVLDGQVGTAIRPTRTARRSSSSRARRPSNPVVLTGDIHSNWVCDVKAGSARPESADRRHRVRRHVDHAPAATVRRMPPRVAGVPAREPAREVLQRPARLRLLHRDADDAGTPTTASSPS